VRAVVVAPLFGIPVEWESIQAFAAAHDAIVIEDAALGHGATYRDRPLGSLGHFSIVSFGRGKGWTGGGGGAFFARNHAARGSMSPDTLVTAGESRNVAALLAQWALGRPAIYGIPRALPLGLGSTNYREPDSPRSMTRAAAAALLSSREVAAREADHRRLAGERILEILSAEIPAATIRVPVRGRAGYLRFPLRLPRGMSSFSDESEALAGGISPTYPTTLGELPQIRLRMGVAEKKWPGATTLVRELVTLPVHSRLGDSEAQANIRLVLKTARK
jgi:dTDP-4-amino-4,6-dideoxygalactose transaminase